MSREKDRFESKIEQGGKVEKESVPGARLRDARVAKYIRQTSERKAKDLRDGADCQVVQRRKRNTAAVVRARLSGVGCVAATATAEAAGLECN